jgi:hypothetical protein
MPVIDGVELKDLVAEYASNNEIEGGTGHGGLTLSWKFDSLADHFLAKQTFGSWMRRGKFGVLACDCGEVGCHPFVAAIEVTDDTVRWVDLGTGSPTNRYSDFGPFIFDRTEYEEALAVAVGRLKSTWEEINHTRRR